MCTILEQNSDFSNHFTTGQDWSLLVIDLMPPVMMYPTVMPPTACHAPHQYQPA